MQRNPFARSLVQGSAILAVLASMGLAACGSSGASSDIKNPIIASDLPVSANDAAIGIPTQNGVQLAIEQNADLGKGYKLTWLGKDDVSAATGKHDATVGTTNITQLANNKSVVAVVGAFNSGVSAAEMPVAGSAGLTMISPANTNVGLTIQKFAADNNFIWTQLHPVGKPEAYFRIPGNDQAQGKLLATAALATPAQGGFGLTKAFVIDDNEVYGKGLADFFTQYFTAGGGSVVGTRQSIDEQHASTFPSLVQQIIAAHPQFLFFGGTTSGGGCLLKKALGAAGAAALPMEGGDGIAQDDQCTKDASPYATGIFGSVAAPNVATLTGGSAFVSAYKTRFGSDPISYSAMSYDAAMVEITAIKSLISAGKPVTRANVLAAVATTSYDGVTGHIAFDANGDNTGSKIFSIWQDDGTNWKFVQNVPIS